jgi:hypothetical protein
MSRKKKVIGICHICGNFGDLTFEHTPQKKAFNNRPVIKVKFEEAISLGPEEITNGPIQQGGIGAHTLCHKCNNNTGSWYGSWFVDWCYQGMDILIRSGGKPSLIYMNYVFPLRILKQIVTMFFSVNPDSFAKANPELVRFVLNRDAKYLPPKYRFFVYYNTTGKFRFSGIVGKADIYNGKFTLMSEITYPPFGYLMTIDSEPPDGRLFEITHFARYSYNDFKVMNLKLPVLPTHLAYPGDYRTKEEILEQAARSMQNGSNGS